MLPGWALLVSGKSAFLDHGGLQHHGAEAGNLAGNVVHAVFGFDELDALDLGALLDGGGSALDLQILNDDDGVAIHQHVAVGILVDTFPGFAGLHFKTAFRADDHVAVGVHVCGVALRAIGDVIHELPTCSFASQFRRRVSKKGLLAAS